jgi:sortase B
MTEQQKPKNKKVLSKKGKVILNSILVVALAVACFSGYKLVTGLLGYKEASDKYESYKEQAFSTPSASASTSSAQPTAAATSTIDWSYLISINANTAGWITLPDSTIDYPVSYADDNDYYLHHLFDGTYNYSGTIFIDYRNAHGFTDKNTVIYGHNMTGSMFSTLNKYADQEFYDSHKTFTLETPTALYRIDVVAGIQTTGTGNYVKLTFDTTDDFLNYVNSFVQESTFQSGVSVGASDQIVVLSTCSPAKNDGRYALMGKLVKIKSYEQ